MNKKFKWVMEEPALMDAQDQYQWLTYGSYDRLFVIDELWLQSLQLFSVEKIYLPLGGDDGVFKPMICKKDIDILFLDISSLPSNDLTTQLARKKIISLLREQGLNPFVLKKKLAADQLNQFYNRAKIVVYINPLLLKTDFANVVYDVLLSGAFLLTDYKTNADKLFNSQLTTFKNIDQLVEQLNYFLKHENEAQKRSEVLREIVLNKHTMTQRRDFISRKFI